MIIDTHSHLDDKRFEGEIPDIIKRAADAGVGIIVTVGIDVLTSRRSVEIAAQFDNVYATVGIHPNCAGQAGATDMDAIAELAKAPKVIAIGETGLDYYRDRCPRKTQISLFHKHIALAKKTNLPLVVHSRAAAKEALDEMETAGAANAVLHCFDGSPTDAVRAVNLGLLIGVTNIVTYPSADAMRASVIAAGLHGIIVETDAPYLPPQKNRGKRNESSYLTEAVQALAALFNVSEAEIREQTTNNAKKFFLL